MKLELDPLDLRPEFKKDGDLAIPTSTVTFEKLDSQAQAAVKVVGRATFYTFDRQNYNAVYAPKPEIKREVVRVVLPPLRPPSGKS